MKLIIALSLLFVGLHAQQAQPASEPIAIVKYDNEGVNADGSYNWIYETANGIQAQESGQLKNPGTENEAIEVQGSAKWTAPDGTPIELTYIANEAGYQPQGSALPTSPPIPPAILKSLEYNAAHPEEDEAGPQKKN